MTHVDVQGPLYLWSLKIKINTPDGGLNTKFHICNKTDTDAIVVANDICARLKILMPSTTEIFGAVISKSNTARDSRILPDAIGDGSYLQTGVDPAATTYNRYDDCISVRFEDEDGDGVTMKLGPIPDTIIGGGSIILPIAAVTDVTVAAAALTAGGAPYATEFTKLMLTIARGCGHVKAKTNVPGGGYDFAIFKRAYVLGVGKKKGGRTFRR